MTSVPEDVMGVKERYILSIDKCFKFFSYNYCKSFKKHISVDVFCYLIIEPTGFGQVAFKLYLLSNLTFTYLSAEIWDKSI